MLGFKGEQIGMRDNLMLLKDEYIYRGEAREDGGGRGGVKGGSSSSDKSQKAPKPRARSDKLKIKFNY